jgi:hypothetical protein
MFKRDVVDLWNQKQDAFRLSCFLVFYEIDYGVAVGVLIVTTGVSVAVGLPTPVAGVLGDSWVLVGPALGCAASGQASRSTGKSVQVLVSVHMLRVRGVISGPLQSTTCFPLLTSTVVQTGSVTDTEVVEVVVDVGGDVISNVAVSGNTNKA